MGTRLDKKSTAVRKQIEGHTFTDEDGDEYEGSTFGGFPDYFRRKKIKLQNLDAEIRASAGDKPQIFKGVVAHVMGYTQPSLAILHKELVQHGAGFVQYLDGKTMATHIIASAMPPKKALEYSRYRIVKPAWVVDSIKAGKILPWGDYRVIEETPRQKTIRLDGGKMMSQATQPSPLGYREQTQNSFYTSRFQNAGRSPARTTSPFATPTLSMGTLQAVENIEDLDDEDMDDGGVDLIKLPGEPQSRPAEKPPKDECLTIVEPDKVEHEKVDEPSVTAETPKEREKPLTSEEHNARLLADPHMRKSSTANPQFLKQYYSESRLHHLSTWKAELKSKMQRLAADKGPAVKTIKRKPGSRRYIMHVDFDSFFCAVSLKEHPELVDKPVVVAHGNGTGSEIASCNYPARKFGVKNGMWMKRALELCPDLKVVPYDFPGYEDASALFYDAILEIGGVVQSVSIDEALVDMTSIVLAATGYEGTGLSEGSIWREQEKADEIALNVRERVKEKTGCNVSVGIGGNILLARVALRKGKPAGQHQIRPEEVMDILGELKVEDLPGVAYSIGGKLEEIGVKFVKDIRQTTKERLTSVLGPKTGEKLWEYSRGIDKTEVGEQVVRKSVSAEVNWGIRFINQEEAEDFARNLCKELERRLLNEGVKGKHLTLKIMRRAPDAPLDPPKHLGHGKCDTFNKSIIFGVATNNAEFIGKEAVAILRSYKFSPGDLRGVGVQLTKLEPLKAATGPDGSQKRLSFGSFGVPPSAKKQKLDNIEDIESPEKPKSRRASLEYLDPIHDDPLTPRKPKAHPGLGIARTTASDPRALTPLNVAGTQFIMPSNADPAVIAELPEDIRRHFVKPPKPERKPSLVARISREPSPAIKPRSESPAIQKPGLPPDVDPEVFNALPEDMKAEILASYAPRPARPARQARPQSVIPQSPRKDRIINHPRPRTTPTKRGGAKNIFSRTKAREREKDARAGLKQTNFLAGDKRVNVEAQLDDVEEIDPAYLAELPEDIRKEVLADHRRRRLARRGGLNIQRKQPMQARRHDSREGPAKIFFPGKPRKVSFTGFWLKDIGEVKDMINGWHRETRDEGPNGEDVALLEKYLARVVNEERDMEKVRKIVKWLEWIVDEAEEDSKGKDAWLEAVGSVKGAVQAAMRERGLGEMVFG